MQSKKYLSLLGLARRADKLTMGHDMVLDSVKKNKSGLLIFSSDISSRLVREFETAAERYKPDLPLVSIDETMDEIHSALGYRAGVISVNDINFASRISELINSNNDSIG